MTFSKGDKVRRIDCDYADLKVGRVYTVSVQRQGALELEGHTGTFTAHRFTLVESAQRCAGPDCGVPPSLYKSHSPACQATLDALAGLGNSAVQGDDTYVAKRDQGKPQFDLLDDGCPLAQLGLVQVLTWAVEVKGYKPHSWQTVPEAIKRYNAALGRHRNAKARGERYDHESGLLHDLHILACATFIAELEARIDKANGLTLNYNPTFNPA